MFTYIKTAFTKPKKIHIGRNMKNSHYFLLLLLMTLSLTLLSLFEFVPIFQGIQNDISEIKSSIPKFELADNQLESNEGSFLYLTNSIAFYFDPEDKMSTQMIDRESATYRAPISIGILDDQIYLNLVGTEQAFHYADSSVIDTEFLMNLIKTFGSFSIGMILLFFLLLFLFHTTLYIYQLLSISLFTNLIRIVQRNDLKFVQTAKMTLLATFIPFIITHLLHAFQLRIAYQFELVFVSSIIIFYISLKDMKKD